MSGGTALPLQGLRVLVTRAKAQASTLKDGLEMQGAQVTEIPVMATGAPQSWDETDKAIAALEQYDWLFFASANAVFSFLGRCQERQKEPSPSISIAAVGPATAKAIEEMGLSIAFMPSVFVAEQLVAEFAARYKVEGLSILWPRGDAGRLLIAEELNAKGASVDAVTCYSSSVPLEALDTARAIAQILKDRSVDAITFASGQSARNFARLALMGLDYSPADEQPQPQILAPYLVSINIVAIGPQTAKSALEELGQVNAVAAEHTAAGLVAALVQQVAGTEPNGVSH